jgi:hypothetical protein
MNDCLNIVAEYLQSNEVSRLGRTFAVRHFPKKITLVTYRDVYQFIQWCKIFDTSNLIEVNYKFDGSEPKELWDRTKEVIIGWVPPSVKRLSVQGPDWWVLEGNELPYFIPDTIEELWLGRSTPGNIPDSVKKLTLGSGFAYKMSWPSQLKELTILGWNVAEESPMFFNNEIDDLPDGLNEIHIGRNVPAEIVYWPKDLEYLTIALSPNQSIRHAPIPNNIVYDCFLY